MVVVGVSALSRSLTNLTTSVRPVLLARLAYRPFTYGSIAQSSLRLVRSFSSDHPAREVDEPRDPSTIRNVAIIAHVDHGKSTLCDKILRDCAVDINTDRVMDSGDLERERGITITSKVTTVEHNDTLLNIVDSPGHQDFGGEVERILGGRPPNSGSDSSGMHTGGLVDGALLIVDATEGPMAQTKFVLSKALALQLRPIVVLNKIDRPTARPDEVENEVFDLFASLDASDEQLDFTTMYASAKDGWASESLNGPRDQGMKPLLDKIVALVPPPQAELDKPFSMLVTMLSRDPFVGRLVTGRVFSGVAAVGAAVHVVSRDGKRRPNARISKILASRGLKKENLPIASAGDIVSIAGVSDIAVGDTIAVPSESLSQAERDNVSTPTISPLWAPGIDPPTVSITFTVNSSPLQGRDGDVLTSQKLGDRLYKEVENNVSISVTADEKSDGYVVQGRGELQLGILVETMRREGAELSLSPPRVVTKLGENGENLEPVEEVTIEVDEAHSGVVIEKISARQGNLLEVREVAGNRSRITFICPSRGLLGYRPIFTSDTRGTGIMNRVFHEWAPVKKSNFGVNKKGLLVSMTDGLTSAHALAALEARGVLFVSPREPVYVGMVVGECNRDVDIDVNPVKEKQLTNFRTHQKDEMFRLIPPRLFSLETAMSYITENELVEVTPKKVRIRKTILNPTERNRKRR